MKQARKEWFSTLSAALQSQGFVKSKDDHTLFIKDAEDSFTAILTYVDDVVLTMNNIVEIQHIKEYLHSMFRIKDIGGLKIFLGLEMARSKSGICLHQCKYTLELLAETSMLASKPPTIPMDPSTRLSKKFGSSLPENTT
jgi:hypothetical protein